MQRDETGRTTMRRRREPTATSLNLETPGLDTSPSSEAVDPDRARPPHGARGRRAAALALSGLFAFTVVATLVLAQQAGLALWMVNAAFLAPGLVLAALFAAAWRRSYRWLVLLLLAQCVYPEFTAPLLLCGTWWATFRSYIEANGRFRWQTSFHGSS